MLEKICEKVFLQVKKNAHAVSYLLQIMSLDGIIIDKKV